jgi:hypothetical protein
MQGNSEERAARRMLDEQLDSYLVERRRAFMPGFIQEAIRLGLDKPAPVKGRPQTWRQRGAKLYGAAFEPALQEALRATQRVQAVRNHQGQAGQPGQTAGGGEDLSSAYHEFEGWDGTAEPPEGAAQTGELDFGPRY